MPNRTGVLSALWSEVREYRKNTRVGLVGAVAMGIVLALWPLIEPIVSGWAPLLGTLPFIGNFPYLFLVLLSASIQFGVVLYTVGTILRIPSIVARAIGEDKIRALRFGLWLQRQPRFFLFRASKGFLRFLWRNGIRTSAITDALDQLFVVRVNNYQGGMFDAWVTKIVKDYSHDRCLETESTETHRMQTCRNGEFKGYILWIFLVDWPLMAMGRPLQYAMNQCSVVAINAKQAASQIATLGQTADNVVHHRALTEADIALAINAITDSEPALVVAGVIDPLFAETMWIERGELDANWREH